MGRVFLGSGISMCKGLEMPESSAYVDNWQVAIESLGGKKAKWKVRLKTATLAHSFRPWRTSRVLL